MVDLFAVLSPLSDLIAFALKSPTLLGALLIGAIALIPQSPEMLTREQAAKYLGLQVQTLNAWACRGCGPKFVKLGRAVRYRKSDLEAYIESRVVQSTGEADEL
jgi:excisionase family DNA binding protein